MNDDAWAQEIERLEALVAGAAGAMAFPLLAEAHRRAGRPEAAERVARDGLARAPHVAAGRVVLALALLDQKRGDEARAELERVLGSEAEHAIAVDAAAQDAPEGVEDEAGGVSIPLEPPGAGPFGPPPPPAAATALFGADEVDDDELDSAFDSAEAQREQMVGADDVARAALAAIPEEDEPAEEEEALVPTPGSPFATATVAGLLERQGHGEQAERIRASLAPAPGPEASAEELEAAPTAPEAASDVPHAPPSATAEPRPTGPARGPSAGRSRKATLERWLENLRRDER